MFESIEEMMKYALAESVNLKDAIINREKEYSGKDETYIISRIQRSLNVMKSSLENSIKIDVVLPIREAMEQSQKMLNGPIFLSKEIKESVYWAMSIAEYNSGMGLICAAPTAGSSGVFPAVLFKARQMLNKTDVETRDAFIIGSAIGVICGNRATLSGSEGGCQAEIGVASAMAAASITYMAHGSKEMIAQSVALALKNVLGLVCDPVAGLVISPCIKRNALGVVNAFLAAEMALSGVKSIIPPDQVIDAMKKVGRKLPEELRETGLGGIADTPAGKKIRDTLFSE